MTFGTGKVANALGMLPQALGNLCRELMPAKPLNKHYRYSPDEVLWLACYRYARATGLEAFPAKVLIGGQAMLLMLRALLASAAPDPAEAVNRLRNVPILYGTRYCLAEAGDETEVVGEPLLIEVQRLLSKLAEPRIAADGAGFARPTVFLTPLAPPLNILDRVIRENSNAA